MPQRFLRPGIRTSEAWNKASFRAQSLYIGILTLVDDFGRYDGRYRLLHAEIFGLRDDVRAQQTAADYEELCRLKLVRHYVVDGKEYLQVLRWQERARVEKSKFPDPPHESAADRSKAQQTASSLASISSPVYPRQRQIGSGEPAALQDWVEELKKDDTYKGIDVQRELGKMINWCKAHKMNPTRRRFVNWLNRVDRPIQADKPKALDKSQLPIAPEFITWALKQYPAKASDIKTWKTWADVPQPLRSEWWREGKSQITDVLTA